MLKWYTLIAALMIELLGTIISVRGLSTLFAGSLLIVLVAISLDVAKLSAVSFLQQYWEKISFTLKCYMTAAVVVLMIITSGGLFSFLSSEFQHASASASEANITLNEIQSEFDRKVLRKQEIDRQISSVPDTDVVARRRIANIHETERKQLLERIPVIEAQLTELKLQALKKNTEIGPINYIATTFNTSQQNASLWIICSIIFVFEPLAIVLLMAANFMFTENKQEPPAIKNEVPDIVAEKPTDIQLTFIEPSAVKKPRKPRTPADPNKPRKPRKPRTIKE